MEKTINPDTQRPYTISMIERLMHDIHFAVDPHSNSKKQRSGPARETQTRFGVVPVMDPIYRRFEDRSMG